MTKATPRLTRGYLTVRDPTHPLALSNGSVSIHRAILWEALGRPRFSCCHWCERVVYWIDARSPGETATGDHLDFDKTNNQRENLVVSCRSCNAARKPVDSFKKGSRPISSVPARRCTTSGCVHFDSVRRCVHSVGPIPMSSV